MSNYLHVKVEIMSKHNRKYPSHLVNLANQHRKRHSGVVGLIDKVLEKINSVPVVNNLWQHYSLFGN